MAYAASLGRDSSTRIGFPPQITPFKSEIAFLASRSLVFSTNANPREYRVSGSVMICCRSALAKNSNLPLPKIQGSGDLVVVSARPEKAGPAAR